MGDANANIRNERNGSSRKMSVQRVLNIQGGAQPTDIFQMFIDNIWKRGKFAKPSINTSKYAIYYPQIKAYFLKITSGRWPPFTSMHCCKRVWKLPYTRLHGSSIAATSLTMACLSSWIVMIRLQNTRSFRNPLRKKSGTVRSGERAGQAMLPKREITVPNISRTTAILFRTVWNGVLSSTVPLAASHDRLSRRCNIQIRNVSVGSAPPCIYIYIYININIICFLKHCYMFRCI